MTQSNMLRFLAAFLTLCSTNAFSQQVKGLTVSPRVSTTTRLFSTVPRALPEGISKSITVEGIGRPVRAGDVVIVKYVCKAAGSDSSFARADKQRILPGDGMMIPGWDMAVRTMREGERATIHISDPQFGYGSAGIPPFVPPNAALDIDIEILNVEDNSGFTSVDPTDLSGGMGMDGPINRPRTPGAIAAAYEQRMTEKRINAPPEKEGIEWVIEKLRTSYFFGLFEGETGQEAPWYLKPSITFPIAFLVVGAAFAVSLLGGAISERGMPSTDELDEIIISSAAIENTFTVAMNMLK